MNAHDGSITGLSWGPATEPCLLLAENFEYMTGAESHFQVQLWSRNDSWSQERGLFGNRVFKHLPLLPAEEISIC